MISTTCKSCGNTRSFEDTYSGRKFKCPSCGKPVTIGAIDKGNSKIDTENTNIEKSCTVEKKPGTVDAEDNKTNKPVAKEYKVKNIDDVRNSDLDIPIGSIDAEIIAPQPDSNKINNVTETEKEKGGIAINSINEGIIISDAEKNLTTTEDSESLEIDNSLAATNNVDDLMNSVDAEEDMNVDSLPDTIDTELTNDDIGDISENNKLFTSSSTVETEITTVELKPDVKVMELSKDIHPGPRKLLNNNLFKKKLLIFIGLFLAIGITAFYLFFIKTSKSGIGNTGLSGNVNLKESEKDGSSGKNIIILKPDSVNITDHQLPESNSKPVEIVKAKENAGIKDESDNVNESAGSDKFNYLTLIQIRNDLLNRPLCEGVTYTGSDQKLTITGNFPDKEYQKKLDLYGRVTIKIYFKDISENKNCIVEVFYKKKENRFDLITHAEK